MTTSAKVVYCDCHGSEKLAEITNDRIIVKDRRHGEHHIAVIPLRDVLDYVPDQALIDKLQNRGYIIDNIIFRKGAAETVKSEVLSTAPA